MSRNGQAGREGVKELRVRLAEAEQTLEAIRTGAADALVVNTFEGPHIYSLLTADQPY